MTIATRFGLTRRLLFGLTRALTLAVLSSTVGPAAAAETPGGLSTADVRHLRSLKLPVAVPTYVPPGFVVTVLGDTGRTGQSYTLRYRARDGREFSIHVSNGGYGDEGPDYTSFRRPYTVNSSALGAATMRAEKGLDTSGADRYTWSTGLLSLKRLGDGRSSLSLAASDAMQPDEVKRIYASLKVMSK